MKKRELSKAQLAEANDVGLSQGRMTFSPVAERIESNAKFAITEKDYKRERKRKRAARHADTVSFAATSELSPKKAKKLRKADAERAQAEEVYRQPATAHKTRTGNPYLTPQAELDMERGVMMGHKFMDPARKEQLLAQSVANAGSGTATIDPAKRDMERQILAAQRRDGRAGAERPATVVSEAARLRQKSRPDRSSSKLSA